MTLVAIHQPNFFPWLGYFDKIRRVDVFIVLDTVQFQKTGGTWGNRVMLNIGGAARWASAPVVRSFSGVRMINEIEFNETTPWRAHLLKTVQANYGRAQHFGEVFPMLTPLVEDPDRRLWAYNLRAITQIAEMLGLAVTKMVLASNLNAVGRATDLLVELVKAVGGTAYLSGGGAHGYQQDEVFARASIDLVYQSFVHPVYPQQRGDSFVPGLSIIDALMHCGVEGMTSLLGASQR